MASGSAQYASHAKKSQMRLQRLICEPNTPATPWLAHSCTRVLATCPTCGANGRGRRTAGRAVTLLFLAVALQEVIAVAVPNPRIIFARIRTARATVHPLRPAALAMGHLARMRVSGFGKTRPADPLSDQAANAAVVPMRGHVREARGESAGDALRSLGREVRVGGVILRSAGRKIRSEIERQDLCRRGCEG
jgi:hypothetical protein